MRTGARLRAALAAAGAGVIHLALAHDVLVGVGVGVSLGGAGLGLAGFGLAVAGLAGFGWGLLVALDERFLVARGALYGALGTLALWALVPPLQLPAAPMIAASVLDLLAAGTLARHLRRERDGDTPRRPAAWALGVEVVVTVAIVVAVVGAGLASASPPGEDFRVPQGHH